MIYVGNRYTASASGSTFKKVVCEHCGETFYYQLTRIAQGEGSSAYFLDNHGAASRAEDRAGRALDRKLRDGCEPTPCCGCGKFQERMVRILRERRLAFTGWLIFGVPLVVLIAGVIIFAARKMDFDEDRGWYFALLIAPLVVGLAFWVLRWVWWHRFDPNQWANPAEAAPRSPEALRLLNDPADFDRPDVPLQFVPVNAPAAPLPGTPEANLVSINENESEADVQIVDDSDAPLGANAEAEGWQEQPRYGAGH